MSAEMILVGVILFGGMGAAGVKIWLNKRKERVRFKKGWESNRLIAQALYRLKEFYKPDQLIVIGFSGGSNDIGYCTGIQNQPDQDRGYGLEIF